MFDKETQKKEAVLKEEAQVTVKSAGIEPVITNAPQVVEESATDVESDPAFNAYMGELGKY